VRKRITIIAVIGLCLAAFIVQLNADESADLRIRVKQSNSGIKDLKATVVVKDSNRKELEKMGKVFAETYQFKKANLCFKLPDCLKINGELGMMKVEFVTAGNNRHIRIPTIRFKKHEDITEEQEKRMSSLDIGFISDAVWDIYSVKLARKEKSESGTDIYVLKLQTAGSKKSQEIWIDSTDLRMLRRDRLFDDGSLKVKTIYSDHKLFGGLWIPIKAEVYNGEGKLAASTETKDIEINTGIEDKEFE